MNQRGGSFAFLVGCWSDRSVNVAILGFLASLRQYDTVMGILRAILDGLERLRQPA